MFIKKKYKLFNNKITRKQIWSDQQAPVKIFLFLKKKKTYIYRSISKSPSLCETLAPLLSFSVNPRSGKWCHFDPHCFFRYKKTTRSSKTSLGIIILTYIPHVLAKTVKKSVHKYEWSTVSKKVKKGGGVIFIEVNKSVCFCNDKRP